jgi:hypothetical protein
MLALAAPVALIWSMMADPVTPALCEVSASPIRMLPLRLLITRLEPPTRVQLTPFVEV